jgi:hypothetical protein
MHREPRHLPTSRPRPKEPQNETTVATAHLLNLKSSLQSHPAVSPKNSASSPALLPSPCPPTMPALASPARASLHAPSPHSFRGTSPLHSAQPHTPPCSPTHASQPHSKSCSGSPAIPSELPSPPSPSETQNSRAYSPSRTPLALNSTAPAKTLLHPPPQAQAEPTAAAEYALHPSSPHPYPRPQYLYPSARTRSQQYYSIHSTHHPAAIPIHTQGRTTTTPSDTAAIPTDTATPTSSPRPDKTPTLHFRTDSIPRPQDTAARTIQTHRH